MSNPKYRFITLVLERHRYHKSRKKKEKSKIKRLLEQQTGYSRATITRLIRQHRETGKIIDRRVE